MDSRSKILQALQQQRGEKTPLPSIQFEQFGIANPLERFTEVLRSIGGAVIEIPSVKGVEEYIFQHFRADARIVRGIESRVSDDPRRFEDVELTILNANFGVAENGAVWVTDSDMPQTVLPFICQHLAVILKKRDIVPTMHHAYERIGESKYSFGTFIAGPSKTADIEQSLVLGAHGPKSMILFLVDGD